jgi:hypothetical protein
MNNTVYFKRQQQLTLRGHQGFSLFSYVDMVAHMLSFLCVCVCERGWLGVCAWACVSVVLFIVPRVFYVLRFPFYIYWSS